MITNLINKNLINNYTTIYSLNNFGKVLIINDIILIL